MKARRGFLAMGLALSLAGGAQGAGELEREWTRIWGSASNDQAWAVAAGADGLVYAAGSTSNGFCGQTNAGLRSAMLVAYDANGERRWSRIWGGTNYTDGYAVTVDSTGAVYVAGQTWSGFDGQAAVGNGDAFLTKFAANGDREWTRIWGSARIDSAQGLAVDASNRIYACGYASTNFDGQSHAGRRDLFYSRFGPDGTRDHSRTWGSTNDDYATGVAVDELGNVFVAGYALSAFDGESFGGSMDAFLSLYRDGVRQWSRMWGGAGVNYAYGVAADGLGNAYVAGFGGPFGGQAQIGDTDAFLCRYDAAGSQVWARIWGSVWGDAAYGVAVAGTNDVFVTGAAAWGVAFDGQGNNDETAFLSRFHADGTRPWTRRWGAGNTEPRGVAAVSTSRVYVGGFTFGAFDGQMSGGFNDGFLSGWAPNVPPTITAGPTATKVTHNAAAIDWTTDKACDSGVEYGRVGESGTTSAVETERVVSHVVALTNLQPRTSYRYRVRSTDSFSNTVESGEHYFETLPAPAGVTNLTFSGAALAPWQMDVEQTGDIERVEFYVDGQLVFTDYSPPFGGGLFPGWVGLGAEDLVGTQEVSAVAYGLDGSNSICRADMSFLADMADMVEVRIVRPEHELTIYTTNAAAPSTNLACRIFARQKSKMPERPGGGWGPGSLGGESFVAATQVEMSVDGSVVGLATNSVPGGTSYYWDFTVNPQGLPIGMHRLTAMADTALGVRFGNTIYFNVVDGLPDIEFERDVEFRDNHFVVTLTVRNEGDHYALLEEVTDSLMNLQPTMGECASATATNTAYDPVARLSRIQFRFPTNALLAAGGGLTLTYRAVPVMHPDDLPERIGGIGARIGYRDWQGTAREVRMMRMTETVRRGGGGEALSLEEAAAGAKAAATYLMVSNPNNLVGLYGEGGGNRVLEAMAHLAVLRGAVLGYYYAHQTLGTKFREGDLAARGNVFGDWRDELVVADSHERYLRVYNGVEELTLISNRLPFARTFYEGDGLGVGNLFPTLGTNDHVRAEIAVANGGGGTNPAGQVDVYLYIPQMNEFDLIRKQTPYGNGCGFAVADLLPAAWDERPAAEMIVVETNGMMHVYKPFDDEPRATNRVAYRPGDEVLTGNLLGDALDEILVVRKSEPRSWAYSYSRASRQFEQIAWDMGFHLDDTVAVGDVVGDERAEILVARAGHNRVDIYGHDAASRAFVCLGQVDFDFRAGDRLLSGYLMYAAKEQIAFLRGTSHGDHARGDVDILVHTGRRGATTAAGLDNFLNANGWWARQLAPAWTSEGYLLIVGETDIVPTFSASWDLTGSDQGRVAYTDRNYASTGRDENNVPELSMGRIVGESADQLLVPLETAIRHGPYVNGTNDAAGPLILLGHARGPDGESDNVDFGDTGSLVSRALRDNGGYAASAWLRTEDLDVDGALEAIAGRDFALLAGHGNWNVWDILTRKNMLEATNVAWGAKHPILYAKSCLTGRYPPGVGMAEAFLQQGAAAYVGATEITIGRWSMRMASAFAGNLDADHTVGSALRAAKRHRLRDSSQTYCWDLAYNRYHSAVFHAYGDPACRLWLPSSRKNGDFPRQDFEGPLSEIEIKVPGYVVDSSNGVDMVSIPGGGEVLIPGMPAVPSYSASVRFPAGTAVQGVALTSRSPGMQGGGLVLPTADVSVDGGKTGAAIPRWKSKAGDWWPDEDFSWSIVEETDGGSTLHVTTYPFAYNSNTTASLFYSNYVFAITHSASDAAIVELVPDSAAYEPGDRVRVEAYVYGSNATPRGLKARAVVRSASNETNGVLPEVALPAARGLAAFALEWDSSGQPVGDYVLDVALCDMQDVVLGRRQMEFSLGSAAGAVVQAGLEPDAFRRGEDVELSATFENQGSSTLSGVVVIQVRRADGTLEAEFRQEFADLEAGGTHVFRTVWSPASLVPRDCRVVAYALYGGNAAPAMAGYEWQTAPLLLEPIGAGPGDVELRWPSVEGRSYDVELSTNLLSPFLHLGTVPASAPLNVYTDMPPEKMLYYRVRERP